MGTRFILYGLILLAIVAELIYGLHVTTSPNQEIVNRQIVVEASYEERSCHNVMVGRTLILECDK